MNSRIRLSEYIGKSLRFAAVVWVFSVFLIFMLSHTGDLKIPYLTDAEASFSIPVFIRILPGYLFSVLTVLGTASGALRLGGAIIKRMVPKENPGGSENILFSIAIGLSFLSIAVFFLALAGLVNMPLFTGIWLLLSLWGAPAAVRKIRNIRFSGLKNYTRFEKASAALLVLFAVLNFTVSFTPDIFYDSLNYHLGVPNFIIQNGSWIPQPFKPHAFFPMSVSMLYLFVVVISGTVAAKLVNFMLGIMVVSAVWLFGKRLLKSRVAGIAGALAFYSIPAVDVASWTASAEMGLVCYLFLSLYAFLKSLRSGSGRWLLVSALLAGSAASVKYTAIIFIAAIAVLFIIRRQPARKLLYWIAVAAIVVSPWLVRNTVITGNPVYPLLNGIIDSPYPYTVGGFGRFSSPWADVDKLDVLAKSPWILSIVGGIPGRYGYPLYYMLGPVFLAFLPLAVLISWKRRSPLISLAVFSLVSYLLWGIFTDKLYFLMPALSAAGLIAGVTVTEAGRKSFITGKAVRSMFVLFAVLNLVLVSVRAQKTYRPLALFSGALSRDNFLGVLPYYRTYSFINENLPEDSRILMFGCAQSYYIKRRFISASAMGLNPFIEYVRHASSAGGIYREMRKAGITHILVNLPEALRTASYGHLYFTPGDMPKLRPFLARYLTEIFEKNGVYLYRLHRRQADAVRSGDRSPVAEAVYLSRISAAESEIRRRNWPAAAAVFDELLDMGFGNYRVHYFSAVCDYRMGELRKALIHAQKACRLKNTPEARTLLQSVKEAVRKRN